MRCTGKAWLKLTRRLQNTLPFNIHHCLLALAVIVKLVFKSLASLLVTKVTFCDLLSIVMASVMRQEHLAQNVHNDWDNM